VENELRWALRIAGRAIIVSADDGAVTVRGTVRNLRQKLLAETSTTAVYGVKTVNNELEVELLPAERRAEADIRESVRNALRQAVLVPSSVEAEVSDGIVTLMGTAMYAFERNEAERVASNITGVIWVNDVITLPSSTRRTPTCRA
jgi:osmotically-inducible protein OsmY